MGWDPGYPSKAERMQWLRGAGIAGRMVSSRNRVSIPAELGDRAV